MSDNSNKVDFRLSPTFLAQLDDLAAEYNEKHAMKPELSRSEFARIFLVAALERESLKAELEIMNGDLRGLRHDIANTVAAMLVQFAKKDSAETTKWVKERFLKE